MSPPYPKAHGLLDGKVTLVTAAAGAGIGYATTRRCAEEGATIVVSDRHERRLSAAADALTGLTGVKPLAVPCDVTSEAQVLALFCGGGGARPAGRGGQQRRTFPASDYASYMTGEVVPVPSRHP
jgi:short chain dehydrogenase